MADSDDTTILSANPDAALLALVEQFRRLYDVHKWVDGEYRSLQAKVEEESPRPSCANGDVYGSPEWEAKQQAYDVTRAVTGAADLWRAVNHTSHAAGMALRQIFKTVAHTPAGVLAKVQMYRLAYGSEPRRGGAGDGDSDLDAYDVDYWTDWTADPDDGIHHDDPDWRPWMDAIVADLERLAGEARV